MIRRAGRDDLEAIIRIFRDSRDEAMPWLPVLHTAEEDLAGRGRVLVRPSGTEPLVRVMVEAPTDEEAAAVCARLVELVRRELA